MLKQFLKIEHIYLDQDVKQFPLTRRVLKKLRGIPVTVVTDKETFLREIQTASLTLGKKNLWLTQFKGAFLKPCPATGYDYLCCRYWTINAQTHCPLDCSYCILQNYLNVPLLTLYVNIDPIFNEMDTLIKNHPGRLFRMGTGELTDSLALDPLTHFNERLITHAWGKPVLLEIKTKTNLIQHLPQIRKKNILVSWSLNPNAFIRTEEFKTASLEKRLAAALAILKKGYRLGFHFDPLLMLPGWDIEYKALIRQLTQRIPEKEVLWISLGSLRFPPSLKKIIGERFPKTRITTEEFVKGLDGKIRYFRPLRAMLYKKIYQELRNHWPEVFIYFCMENSTVWQDVMGFAPKDNPSLDYLFHENIKRRFPDLKLPLASLKYYKAEKRQASYRK